MTMQSKDTDELMTPQSAIDYFRTSDGGGVLQAAAKNAEFDLREPEEARAPEFVAAMARANVTTLKQFDEVIEQHAAVLPRYFDHISTLTQNAKKGRTLASYPFMGELVLLLAYPERFDVGYLTEVGWDADIVELTFRAAQATRVDTMENMRTTRPSDA
ncbi:hypothetical protein G3N95_14790 [Paraburkholderia sp. Tr-20389]|uniref:hypothetical protein n=1 Tax=Paraburkholderia sp. Tr-20389 TaxID=2703903 RepID=UPI00197CEB74|nr:hypothetical protein [Paraburkholderia sp. Tr-20389]MBN3754216.1 hypothetical protein [Paraburkholderia sp. Tr-20389]